MGLGSLEWLQGPYSSAEKTPAKKYPMARAAHRHLACCPPWFWLETPQDTPLQEGGC